MPVGDRLIYGRIRNGTVTIPTALLQPYLGIAPHRLPELAIVRACVTSIFSRSYSLMTRDTENGSRRMVSALL